MAFICCLKGESFNANVHTRGSSRIVTAPIGIDDSSCVVYSLFVALDVLAGGDYEIIFMIVGVNTDTGEEFEYWSGRDTQSFILGDDRKAVLGAIVSCVANLIRVARPQRLSMCTYDDHLPDSALVKYMLVAQAVEECGYVVRIPDPFNGRRIWFMERLG